METHFTRFLSALCEMVGLEDLTADENGACDLVFDDLPVTMQYDEKTMSVLIYCAVGEIAKAPEKRLHQYNQLLQGNFLFTGTAGATLAADDHTGLISMQRSFFVLGLENVDFFSLLETFLNMAMAWRGKLTAQDEAEADGSENSSPPSSSGWVMA